LDLKPNVDGYDHHVKNNTTHVECVNISNVHDNRGCWNHIRIIQKIPEQHTGKHDVEELQEAAILGTAHVLQKVQSAYHVK
jgi:hypothetical protein